MENKFGQGELIDLARLVAANKEVWVNIPLSQVNDSLVRLGIIEGEYHWHKHNEEDEFFYVVSGKLLLDFENETIELLPQQGYTVPKGVLHRTRALEKTVIIMVEKDTVVPSGN